MPKISHEWSHEACNYFSKECEIEIHIHFIHTLVSLKKVSFVCPPLLFKGPLSILWSCFRRKVNSAKSELDHIMSQLWAIWVAFWGARYPLCQSKFKYLGLPLDAFSKTMPIWDVWQKWFECQLDSWKMNLYRWCRIALIKSTLSTCLHISPFLFLQPISMTNQIEKVQWDSFDAISVEIATYL